MSSTPEPVTASPSKLALGFGYLLTLLSGAALGMSAMMKFSQPKEFVEQFPKLGYDLNLAAGIGALELTFTLLYLFPRTAVLGAALLTAYLGGAVATHVRVYDAFSSPIIVGVLVWSGLLLRDVRLRALFPFRSPPAAGGIVRRLSVVKIILALLVVAVASFLFKVALQKPEMTVTRSETINAPPAVVFEHVNDLHKWNAWSPFVKYDPNAKHTFEGADSGVGAAMHWSGNDDIGEGRMTITNSVPAERIVFKLEFLKPFQATNPAEFTFRPEGDKTIVSWSMTSRNDYGGRIFCSLLNMEKKLGDDFSSGLASMKSIVEGAKEK